MISKTIGFGGTNHFQTHPVVNPYIIHRLTIYYPYIIHRLSIYYPYINHRLSKNTSFQIRTPSPQTYCPASRWCHIAKKDSSSGATQHRTTWLISAYLVYTAYCVYIYIQKAAKLSICIWCVCLLIYIYVYIYIHTIYIYIYYISSSPKNDAESPFQPWYFFQWMFLPALDSKSRRPGEMRIL